MVNRGLIKRIEKLRLPYDDRAELILTYLRLTPAAHFDISGYGYNYFWKNVQDIPSQVINELERTLSETGMPYKISDVCCKGNLDCISWLYNKLGVHIARIKEKLEVYFAQDDETLDRLLEAVPAYMHHREYGRLMGFPDTAIQAFLGERERLDVWAWHIDPSISRAKTFALSKSHYQQELNIVKNWSEALREYAPELYKESKSDYRRLRPY